MKISEAIKQADMLRLNTLEEETKAQWLNRLDGDLAEMVGVEPPEFTWPGEEELLMPAPHDDIYVMYLVAKIDYYNNEMASYANDMMMFNQAMNEARAWYRRNNRAMPTGNWRVM